MAVFANRFRYLRSLALELRSQTNRVRDLIGDSHWLSDGHHKEYLLTSLLTRHLPAGVLVSRGFLINPINSDLRSTEQDLLVVDASREAPLFHQGNLLITFPQQVLACISVKATLDKATMIDSLRGLRSAQTINGTGIDPSSIWFGAYFFESRVKDSTLVYDYVGDFFQNQPACLSSLGGAARPSMDSICSGGRHFYKLAPQYLDGKPERFSLNGYNCRGIATAMFLGDLLGHVAARRGAKQSYFSDLLEEFGVTALGVPSRVIDIPAR